MGFKIIGATWFIRGAGIQKMRISDSVFSSGAHKLVVLRSCFSTLNMEIHALKSSNILHKKLELKNTYSDQSCLAVSFKSFRFKLNSRLRTLEDSEVYDSIVMNIS